MAFVQVYIPGEGFRQVDTKSSMSVDKARRAGGNVTLDTKSEPAACAAQRYAEQKRETYQGTGTASL